MCPAQVDLVEMHANYPIIFSEPEVIKRAAVSLREIILIFLNRMLELKHLEADSLPSMFKRRSL